MTQTTIGNYSKWRSPITSDLIVSGSIGLGAVKFDDNNIYWLESRPSESGRCVIVCLNQDDTLEDITPKPFNVRSRVHEYGGGAFFIHDSIIYFTNFVDQRVYKQKKGKTPQPLTPESKLRYADFVLDKSHNRLICVAEDHSNDSIEPENKLVLIDLTTGEVKNLVTGADFYSSPRLSPDNSQLAWIAWHHPNMPWDNTELYLANINPDGSLTDIRLVAGGKNESICQPEFSPNGILYFSSDRRNWWNIYRRENNGNISSLYPLDAEFGYPHWVFGESVYGFADENTIICTYTQDGISHLASLDTKNKSLTDLNIPFTNIAYLQVNGDQILFTGGSPTQPTAVVKLNIATGDTKILKQSSNLDIDSGYLSQPQQIEFPTSQGKTAFAWYYPPQNKDFSAPEDELPPLLVKSHGGPTAATTASYNLRIQYWTSRGFAFVDVNYGGSTGYGRDYRQRLNNNWGIVDVEDCINVAQYLVKQRKVDENKLAISGGSAGGYTTLAALTFHDTFKAGASYYGVGDLEALAKDTHKFESRYLDNLIGKYPEEKAIYQARSPINHIDKLSCPVAFFQGLEDKIVPPNQAEMMVKALENKGIKTMYVTFPDEQHGFRKAENIKLALDNELKFYNFIFNN
ncbi:S9 family peptidase [Geminocystis sp. NIES-3709]|uniref:S9 family peptidase n=1 Tax=Geminocystis sp. NIES-3709 TaxID=1617448 RepID=UPI0005FC59B8|nr:S9 family peptidase [Geminocystis sp. NIES-3709]BAQ63744.1 prolyl oligopeptidase family protein [Geminocystis sp. NIES-3709]